MGSILVMTGHTLLGEGLVRLIRDLALACDVELALSIGAVLDIANRGAVDTFLLAEPTYALPILSAAHMIRHRDRQSRIIALQARETFSSPFHLFCAGVFSVLQHDCTVDELGRAVSAVRKGQPYFAARVQRTLAADLYGRSQPHLELSHREFDILSLLIHGFSASETARRLAISAQTVCVYKARIQQHLHVNSFSEMVCYGLAHGLLGNAR